MHPGTNVLTTYQGMMWWDNETDGDKMYPDVPLKLSSSERAELEDRNPEGSALKGLWGDVGFLSRTGTPEFNSQLSKTQFADFHGHGWVYRAVFKRDRKGNLLDSEGDVVPSPTGEVLNASLRNATEEELEDGRPGVPVHLKDIHLERGMHCVDCHFEVDVHGNGNLYGEPRNAIEIDCIDCHGTVEGPATLLTTGPAAPGRRHRPPAARDAVRRATVHAPRPDRDPAVDDERGSAVDRPADRREHHAGQRRLQRACEPCQDHAARRHHLGARRRRRTCSPTPTPT